MLRRVVVTLCTPGEVVGRLKKPDEDGDLVIERADYRKPKMDGEMVWKSSP